MILVSRIPSVHVWNQNGDHPKDYSLDHIGIVNGEPETITKEYRKENNWEGDIVRYYRRPDISGRQTCPHCQQLNHYHGWIDTPSGGRTVCPGDLIVETENGQYYPIKPAAFKALFPEWDSQDGTD